MPGGSLDAAQKTPEDRRTMDPSGARPRLETDTENECHSDSELDSKRLSSEGLVQKTREPTLLHTVAEIDTTRNGTTQRTRPQEIAARSSLTLVDAITIRKANPRDAPPWARRFVAGDVTAVDSVLPPDPRSQWCCSPRVGGMLATSQVP